jgi:hypothetical protein
MSLADIRAAVKAILETVPGIGLVYEYERYAKDAAGMRALFVSGGLLHGWTITRDRTLSSYRTNVQTERHHRLVIRGYYGLSDGDASELTFQGVIEAIEETFRSNDTLNATAEVSQPLQVERVGPVLFAGVLCHFAELSIEAQELV